MLSSAGGRKDRLGVSCFWVSGVDIFLCRYPDLLPMTVKITSIVGDIDFVNVEEEGKTFVDVKVSAHVI